MLCIRFFLLILCLISPELHAQNQVDVLIIGGGAGGTAAGIQAARSGVQVQIMEATPWLGGMLTSAGVSAIDGNHDMPSGIWGEFRQRLRNHYGGAKGLATGWVSHTLFEPSVGQEILREMAQFPNLKLTFNANYTIIKKRADGWHVTYEQNKKTHIVLATILIDATETGEVLPLVNADFRYGMDSKVDTGEKEAPQNANDIIQDLTYVAILEDVSQISSALSKKGLVKKPKNYDPEAYECACKRKGGEMFGQVSGCEQMLNYAKLPNGKYMINWPHCGNDFYIGWKDLSNKELENEIAKAKEFTLGFIYYIQQELGFDHLRLANEFGTKDKLPMIPYHREGRRAKGKVFLTVDHLERPYDFNLYKTGVAVGDYPIDHHHDKNANAPVIDFINIKVPSYSIPMGALIPMDTDNLLVADKNISVSNIVNGTTRLQPVVLGIGQAAGAIAATAIKKQRKVSEVSVRDVQQLLLEHNAYLLPLFDVKPADINFSSIQKIAASGVLKTYGIPYKWANQTFFYPERIVSEYELKQGLLPYFPQLEKLPASGHGVKISFLEKIMETMDQSFSLASLEKDWNDWGIFQTFHPDTELNRESVSVLVDKLLDPFSVNIDLQGNLQN
ncbi:FAD-dependent oxidoreductase [Euzebyella saccharophila]|uniref:FAD-dependent oxidoreductase n=1 Tax=Euzebyella saccharophila TaxID=679664 RepID=A0ABV8JSV8_9FLAO|nr:FAD-dependent oxidoreductase [Euzebyella saccharophila]